MTRRDPRRGILRSLSFNVLVVTRIRVEINLLRLPRLQSLEQGLVDFARLRQLRRIYDASLPSPNASTAITPAAW